MWTGRWVLKNLHNAWWVRFESARTLQNLTNHTMRRSASDFHFGHNLNPSDCGQTWLNMLIWKFSRLYMHILKDTNTHVPLGFISVYNEIRKLWKMIENWIWIENWLIDLRPSWLRITFIIRIKSNLFMYLIILYISQKYMIITLAILAKGRLSNECHFK